MIKRLIIAILVPIAALAQTAPTAWIDPFTGVDGGNVYCGATLPFALCKPGPESSPPYNTSGYKSENILAGFNHTHLSGTGGEGRYGNIRINPYCGNWDKSQANAFKSNEYARPGYYQVTMQRKAGDVHCELTSGNRNALHRYRYFTWKKEDSINCRLVISPTAVISRRNNADGSRCTKAYIKRVSNLEFEGYGKFAGGWGAQNPYTIYFSIKVDAPADSVKIINHLGDWVSSDEFSSDSGKSLNLHYIKKGKQNQFLNCKVGISLLSVKQAAINREETGTQSFDEVRQSADKVWNNYLNKIKVSGGSPENTALFYTALYHTFILPHYVEGENTDGIPFWDHYCLWDVHRTTMPLHLLIDNTNYLKMVKGLLKIYQTYGWLPDAWVAGGYAQMQGGSNADVVLADAVVKGHTELLNPTLWAAVTKNAETNSDNSYNYGRNLTEYLPLGYSSSNIKCGSSQTLEYAYNDFCISQIAEKMGKTAEAEKYRKRSLNAFNLFYQDKGFFWAKDANGIWASGFRPDFSRPDSWNGPYFYEGSPWNYLTYVPHDMAGLVKRIGGAKATEQRLDSLFSQGYFDLGNEPEFLAPYAYHYIGRPDKTAITLKAQIAEKFMNGRKGWPGQDDSGAFSAWFVFNAMGIYPVAGQDVYLLSTPFFREVEMSLPANKKLKIKVIGPMSKISVIHSATLNGKAIERAYLRHSEIAQGGLLQLTTTEGKSSFGSTQVPPSLSTRK